MKRKVTVTDDVDDAEMLVCLRLTDPLKLADNLIDVCSKCRLAIQHRPNVPDVPKVCEVCATPLFTNPDTRLMITPKTVQEVRDYWRKRQ
jgi:hypothetical protein